MLRDLKLFMGTGNTRVSGTQAPSLGVPTVVVGRAGVLGSA